MQVRRHENKTIRFMKAALWCHTCPASTHEYGRMPIDDTCSAAFAVSWVIAARNPHTSYQCYLQTERDDKMRQNVKQNEKHYQEKCAKGVLIDQLLSWRYWDRTSSTGTWWKMCSSRQRFVGTCIILSLKLLLGLALLICIILTSFLPLSHDCTHLST